MYCNIKYTTVCIRRVYTKKIDSTLSKLNINILIVYIANIEFFIENQIKLRFNFWER